MPADVRFSIDLVSPQGQPLEPKEAANAFTSQCGVIVRDKVPITTRNWNKPGKKKDPAGASFVDDRAKDTMWNSLMTHFTLPVLETDELTQQMTRKVKHFALKKMGELFKEWKKRLYHKYVLKKKLLHSLAH